MYRILVINYVFESINSNLLGYSLLSPISTSPKQLEQQPNER